MISSNASYTSLSQWESNPEPVSVNAMFYQLNYTEPPINDIIHIIPIMTK